MHKIYFGMIFIIALIATVWKNELWIVFVSISAMSSMAYFRTQHLIETKKGSGKNDSDCDC